jgi:hypothetical protein
MLYYRHGNEARVGDRVAYDGEPSVVEELVDTEEKRLEWRVDYLGLLLTNRAFGRVYVEADDVEFIGRGIA